MFFRLKDRLFLPLIILLALVVRVIFVLQWQDTPYGHVPLLDAKAYDDWAMIIADGHLWRERAFYQSPLYPYLLGLLYKIVGHNLMMAGLMNALMGAATVGILAAITRTLFGTIAAMTTAALATLYLPFIFYTAPVMKEPLGLMLLAAHLFYALQLQRTCRARDALGAGITLGLAILVRGNMLLLVPILPVALIYAYHIKAARAASLFLVAVLVTIAPATLHNAVVAHDFVPISYADGFNLYIGHSPTANGTNAYPPEVSTDPLQEELAVTYVANHAVGTALPPSQISAYWRDRAFIFMLENPLIEMDLLFTKLVAFWNNHQPFDNYDPDFIAKNFGTMIAHPLFEFWIVAVLACFASLVLLCCPRPTSLSEKLIKDGIASPRDTTLIIAYCGVTMLSVVLFYVTDRYRLPIVIFLLPLAGAATPCIQGLLHRGLLRLGMIAATGALMMLFLTLRPHPTPIDLTAFDWGTLAAIYSDMGQDRETLAALEKGVKIAPDQIGSQAFVRGAVAEDHLGHPAAARRWLEAALSLYPNDGIVWYNIGRMRAANGNLDTALTSFYKARDLAPTYTLTYYALAKIYQKQGNSENARKALHEGLLIAPDDRRLNELAHELFN